MYLITGPSGVYIIDPSVSPKRTEDFCADIPDLKGLSEGRVDVRALFITHGHHDHIKHVSDWHHIYPNVTVYMSGKDQELLDSPFWNCSYMDGREVVYKFSYSDIAGKDGDVIYKDPSAEFKVFETPGHSMGSVCYLVKMGVKEKMFTGDTVFNGSIGRTDMHGGTSKLILKSVLRLKSFDPELAIYPGHGPDSTIGEEIRVNPYFDL